MAKRATAIDLGSHSLKALQVKSGKRGLCVTRFASAPSKEGARAIAAAGISLKGAVVGLAGRDMTLRYSQVPPTPDWQLHNLMDLEIQDLAAQSGGALSADYNLLPPQDQEGGVDTVLLVLAKDDALRELERRVAEGSGTVDGFVPNCIALYNAYLKCGPIEEDSVVCLANIGHETLDIALCKGVDLLFARNLTGGGRVLDDAISAAFNVSPRKAESLKMDLLDLDPQSRGRYASGQAEKVTLAAGGAASAIVAGIQSSVAFCKSQTKIRDLALDKVLICGGSARLRGLRGMLREVLRCPVEPFDPFANADLSALPSEDAEQLSAMREEAVVALGLAAGRCDDSLYSLEILPEAVRRRKRFLERTIYNAAAVAIAVLLLLFQFRKARADLEQAEENLRVVSRQRSQAESTDRAVRALLEENRRLAAMVGHLEGAVRPLHAALRTLRAIGAHLPEQLWITRFEVGGRRSPAGQRNRPLVSFTVAGKELGGADVGEVYLKFSSDLKGDPSMPGGGVTSRPASRSGANRAATIEQEVSIDFPDAAGTAGKEVR
ncbi:MAG: hypothetical protein Fur0037_02180 [Planctomycetota bacterium]